MLFSELSLYISRTRFVQSKAVWIIYHKQSHGQREGDLSLHLHDWISSFARSILSSLEEVYGMSCSFKVGTSVTFLTSRSINMHFPTALKYLHIVNKLFKQYWWKALPQTTFYNRCIVFLHECHETDIFCHDGRDKCLLFVFCFHGAMGCGQKKL